MTVSELIDRLKQYRQDATVMVMEADLLVEWVGLDTISCNENETEVHLWCTNK